MYDNKIRDNIILHIIIIRTYDIVRPCALGRIIYNISYYISLYYVQCYVQWARRDREIVEHRRIKISNYTNLPQNGLLRFIRIRTIGTDIRKVP